MPSDQRLNLPAKNSRQTCPKWSSNRQLESWKKKAVKVRVQDRPRLQFQPRHCMRPIKPPLPRCPLLRLNHQAIQLPWSCQVTWEGVPERQSASNLGWVCLKFPISVLFWKWLAFNIGDVGPVKFKSLGIWGCPRKIDVYGGWIESFARWIVKSVIIGLQHK